MTLQLPGDPDHDPERQAKFEAIQLAWPTAGLSPSLPSAQSLRLLTGGVSATGTTAFPGTGDWTVARTPAGAANGDYTITFTTPFTSTNLIPDLTVSGPSAIQVVGVTTSTMRVVTSATVGGVAADGPFYFTVYGPVA